MAMDSYYLIVGSIYIRSFQVQLCLLSENLLLFYKRNWQEL